tara:strand:+ start:1202 stop:1357 length:156 start_codon:yes stop_codon:yes gene_type:complete
MIYAEKQKAIKNEALSLLKKDTLSKREMAWFLKKMDRYKDTDEIWVTQKID